MLLTEFQIYNYRSVVDSGPIPASNLTAIIGRNESGKSNLLRALQFLNPVGEVIALNKSEVFPRHLNLHECEISTKVVTSIWKLSGSDRKELAQIWPSSKRARHVEISITYVGKQEIRFSEVPVQVLPSAEMRLSFSKFRDGIESSLIGFSDSVSDPVNQIFDTAVISFESTNESTKSADENLKWIADMKASMKNLRQHLSTIEDGLAEEREVLLAAFEGLVDLALNEEQKRREAQDWIITNMPKFVFFDVYPELIGSMNVYDHLRRRSRNPRDPADVNFEKMCAVAGLDLEELNDLETKGDQRTRNQLVNQAGAKLTKEIRRLWRDKKLKVRFNLDGNHMTTFVSEPSGSRDVDIELNERSRGFQWFFSFYIVFAADTQMGDAANSILLLDEPGLYLHAKSQRDLLVHLDKGIHNQILFTTHSPFMVPVENLDDIRVASFDEKKKTIVENNLMSIGDSRTLFPLQVAIGFDLSQSLSIGVNNLIVEGYTDQQILTSASNYFSRRGEVCLQPNITVTPVGGAQKIWSLVALLSSENINLVVLLDREAEALKTRNGLIKARLIREKKIVFISEGLDETDSREADIEDLLDPAAYEKLVRKSYAGELKGKTLGKANKTPRITVRFKEEFKKIGLEFNKSRPTHLLLDAIKNDPEHILTQEVKSRFIRLFNKINSLMKK